MTGDNAVHILWENGTPTMYDQHGNDLGSVGSDSGSSLVQVASVVLDNDQIKALPTTHQLIIAAPGANKLLLIERALLITNWGNANKYTNIAVGNSSVSVLYYGAELIESSEYIGNAILYGQAVPAVLDVPPSTSVASNGASLAPRVIDQASSVDQPINLYAYNAGQGDFTGGNPANTLTVVTYYTVLDLAA